METTAGSKEARNDAGRSAFSAEDVETIARRRGWLAASPAKKSCERAGPEITEAHRRWLARTAQLLGAQAANLPALERLLELVFSYDAAQLLARAENQAVVSREGARDVLRELAAGVLDSPVVDSDRFKEIISALKETTGRRGPELFHPLRLALAGSAGEGEYDRVILVLDEAARLLWGVTVKGNHQRILEFCSALD